MYDTTHGFGTLSGGGGVPGDAAHALDGYASLAPDEVLEASQRQARNARLAEQTGYVDSNHVTSGTARWVPHMLLRAPPRPGCVAARQLSAPGGACRFTL